MSLHINQWPLTRRLLAVTMTLLVILSAFVGTASIVVLRQTLIGRLDDQILSTLATPAFNQSRVVSVNTSTPKDSTDEDGTSVTTTTTVVSKTIISTNPATLPATVPLPQDPTPSPSASDGDTPSQEPRGHRIGMLTATIVGDTVITADYVGDDGYAVTIPAAVKQSLLDLPVDDTIHTVDLGEFGHFRIAAHTNPTTPSTLVSGLSLKSVDTTITSLTLIFALAALLALLAAGLIGSWVIRSSLRPLTTIAETATRVSERPLAEGEVALPERVPVDAPGTEVGKVGSALNRMLGHIETSLTKRQASEDKLRRFIADASHELRTPLASVRGYSELALRRSETLPPEHRQAIERINAESIRMSSLVADLLLLARLDAGQEIQHEPVELAQLLVTAVMDAEVAGPDHEWSVDIPEEDPVEVLGAADSLHQVLSNLLANARIHTPAGTTVTASLTRTDTDAVITIRDDGPGIDPAIRADLFERFVRGDVSRSRSNGSSGLGLSIAHAIVTAHHGTIAAEEPDAGTGAAFKITLPLAPPATKTMTVS